MRSSCNVIKGSIISGHETIITPVLSCPVNGCMEQEADGLIGITDDSKKQLFEELRLMKQQLMKKAQNEADEIIKSADIKAKELMESSIEEGYQKGYKEGYQQGYSYGIDESEKECKGLKDDADKYLSQCQEAAKAYIKAKEESIIDLSIEIAKHIIHNELTLNPDAICKMAQQAISKVADKQQVILKVSPQDLPFIKNKRDELAVFINNPSDIIIVSDASIKQGCVTAETSSGFADTDIDSQLLTIKRLLTGD